MILDAVVLAGGRSSRLGGVPKAALQVDGTPLLALAVRAAAPARRIVVVGEPGAIRLPDAVTLVREDPPFGGPVAGLAAGVAALAPDTDAVLVLACDAPRAAQAVPALLDAFAATDADGARAVAGGHPQHLLAVYRAAPLRRALAALGDPTGAAMRALVGGLDLVDVSVAPEVAADIDTWEDAAAAGIARPRPEPASTPAPGRTS